MDDLAINGGEPVREERLPYGQQWIDQDDIQSVVHVLQSDWLTTGPKVEVFEKAFSDFVGSREAVAVSNGTAALHAAVYAAGVEEGDEVIVPPMTFAATANSVVYQGATPVFADVDPETLLLDPEQVEKKLTPRTKALISVDYTGQPCDYDALTELAKQTDLVLIADACHALGGSYHGELVGTLADLNTFSFHPVKHITSGEGGMITTGNPELAHRMRVFRNHGITTDHRRREELGSWFYEMVDLGYNYRLTDLQCALGISQLKKFPAWLERRREIARRYDLAFSEIEAVESLKVQEKVKHAYHLYMVRIRPELLRGDRSEIFSALLAEGIGVNVHYIPVHLHPFYCQQFNTGPGKCPVAEAAYEHLITLPLFPKMKDQDVSDVIRAVEKVISAYQK